VQSTRAFPYLVCLSGNISTPYSRTNHDRPFAGNATPADPARPKALDPNRDSTARSGALNLSAIHISKNNNAISK
jgi:hypothetical protein